MKKRILKAKKAVSHSKPVRTDQTKQCDCCESTPCTCPESHGHKN